MEHHMTLNCKPYVPTSRLLYGDKKDLISLFPSLSEIEIERSKRKLCLTKKQADVQFCIEELEIVHEDSMSPINSFSPRVTQELENNWIELVKL
ncbi:hypothetical protein KM1_016740 [Entamoeba histolytica HM-3:IMSS]|uniref:Uncharacterized protein n=2 Tax=Entamoeba histolytica TaxID=5759 RepID=A0A175JEN4_ENTHI|nr:hypothetical protein KM1_016740 [Entamoeba histolytica HM-3:IMSS]GAT92057.1 hypothetical protein CL6EHI_c00104 [Entamoeba histolytica]